MTCFPTISVPIPLLRAARELPPAPAFEEKPPILPAGSEPQPINAVSLIWQSVGLLVIAALIFLFARILGTVVLIAGVVGLILQIRIQVIGYQTRLRDRNALMENYFRLLEAYSRQAGQHQQAIANSRSPERLAAFRRTQILEILTSYKPTEKFTEKPTEKLSENGSSQQEILDHPDNVNSANNAGLQKFGDLLHRYFPTKIQPKITFSIPGQVQPYSLPFAYIDPSTNLHIAIEIAWPVNRSQPGTLVPDNTKIANDFDSWQTEARDLFLLKAGWLIVRFASTQINQFPSSCCKTVAIAINDLLGEPELLYKFSDITDLEPVNS